jgi:hypothetical protein
MIDRVPIAVVSPRGVFGAVASTTWSIVAREAVKPCVLLAPALYKLSAPMGLDPLPASRIADGRVVRVVRMIPLHHCPALFADLRLAPIFVRAAILSAVVTTLGHVRLAIRALASVLAVSLMRFVGRLDFFHFLLLDCRPIDLHTVVDVAVFLFEALKFLTMSVHPNALRRESLVAGRKVTYLADLLDDFREVLAGLVAFFRRDRLLAAIDELPIAMRLWHIIAFSMVLVEARPAPLVVLIVQEVLKRVATATEEVWKRCVWIVLVWTALRRPKRTPVSIE